MEKILQYLIYNYLQNPSSDETNYQLAICYHNMGQTASAVSFYLRTAERTEDSLLAYECLLRASMCFDTQGTRGFTVKGLLQHAISILPKRPEAYYLLSKYFEKENNAGAWKEGYMISSIGNELADLNPKPLRTCVGYPPSYGLLFQKAVSSWWCGLCEESRNIFKKLLLEYHLDESHYIAVMNNLKFMKLINEGTFVSYDKSKYNRLKNKFNGSEHIEKNYSEAYQDLFILTILNGKKNGTYLEIGAGNPFYGSNTALLEQQFDWKGIALDIDETFVSAHKNERKNLCLPINALDVDYKQLLNNNGFEKNIDYLQIDCDPHYISYQILTKIPFNEYKFAVITYEHDAYCDLSKSYQELAKQLLESKGYIRVVNNIAPDGVRSYEDWWIHPELVDPHTVAKMIKIGKQVNKAEDYLLER